MITTLQRHKVRLARSDGVSSTAMNNTQRELEEAIRSQRATHPMQQLLWAPPKPAPQHAGA